MIVGFGNPIATSLVGWLLVTLILLTWLPSSPVNADHIRIEGEYRTPEVEAELPRIKTLLMPFREATNKRLQFGPLSEHERQRIADLSISNRTGPRHIGIHRDTDPAQGGELTGEFGWESTEGGWVGSVTVSSPEAKNIRIQLQASAIDAVELTFFDFGEFGEVRILDSISVATETSDLAETSYHQTNMVSESLWSPPATGSVIGLEVFAPNVRVRDSFVLNVKKLAHGFDEFPPRSEIPATSSASNRPIGTSIDACSDVLAICNTSSFSSQASDASAGIRYEKGGLSSLCTATLVNDNAPGTQHYMVTANHCIDSSTVAATIVAFWFYQPSTCDGTDENSNIKWTYGGADLIKSYPQHDSVLLDLKSEPPANVYYAGISTSNSHVAINSSLIAIHHRRGGLKKYFQGLVENTNTTVRYCDNNGQNCITFDKRLLVRNKVGITGPGASGGGLFNGSNLVAAIEGHTRPLSCTGGTFANAMGNIYSQYEPFLDPPTPTTPIVSFDKKTSNISEHKSSATVSVSISTAPTSDVMIPYTIGGTADSTDYTPPTTKSVTINANSTSSDITVSIVNDDLNERDETVVLTLVDGPDYDLATSNTHTLSIYDDDNPPRTLTLKLSETSLAENAGETEVTVTATISGRSRWGDIQLMTVFVDGSGESNVVGFPEVPAFILPISRGAVSGTATFSITPTNDSLYTGDETVTVSGDLRNVTVSPATLTLSEDDAAPTDISLSISPTSVSEGAGKTEVTVTATIDGTARWGADKSLSISVDGSNANDVVGFATVPEFNLTIAEGAASGTAKFSITPANDNVQTGNETVTVSGALADVTVSPANLTLTDNDIPPSAVALSLSPTSVSEGAGKTEVTVTATIDGTSRWLTAQTLPISVAGSGASNVVGFPAVSNFNLTIPKGAASGTAKFSFTPTNDNFDTGNETITVSSTLTGVTVSSAELTLTDDDTAPSAVALSLSPSSIAENAGATEVTVTATIDGTSQWTTDQTLSISVAGSGGSNVVGFPAISNFNLTIPRGTSLGTAKFSITPTNDSLDSGNETVSVSGTLAGVTVSSAKLILTDDDDAPASISLSLSPTSIAEGAGETEVTVTATIDDTARWGAEQVVSISADGSGGSNVVGFAAIADFNLTIPKGAGSGTAKFSITPTSDNVDTGNETITVAGTLNGVTVSSANLSLTDDDSSPTDVTLEISINDLSEGAGKTEITVTANVVGTTRWGTAQTLTVSVGGTGLSNVVGFAAVSDFQLTIPKGADSGTAKFSITPIDDNLDTKTEVITVSGTLTGVSVRSVLLLLIDDDDPPSAVVLSLSPTSVSEGAGETEVTVTATISDASRWVTDQTLSISVDGSGTSGVVGFQAVADFNLTIPKGADSGTAKFSITPTNDGFDTSNETITVSGTLTDVTVNSANLTLTDDDVAPSAVALSLSPTSVSEGAGKTEVTVTATIGGTSRWTTDQFLSISVAGSGGSNVVGFPAVSNFNLTIPKGAVSGSAKFSLTPTNDNVDSGNETITVSGSLLGVTVSSAKLTLTDDDSAPSAIVLSLSPTSVSEGAGKTEVTVTATIGGSVRFGTSHVIAITATGSGGSNVVEFGAISGFNLTIPKEAASGSAKFSITPTNDNLDTGNETIAVAGTLSGVTVSPANLTLTDDDVAPSVVALSISPTSVSEGAGKTEVSVTATIVGTTRWSSAQTLTISAAGSGASNVVGFSAISNINLTIPKGANSGSAKFSITPTNDNLDTGNETVAVRGMLSGVTVRSTNLTLTDDDTAPSAITLSLSPTIIGEEAGATEVTVTATVGGVSRWSTAQSVAISVNGSGLNNVVGFSAVSDFSLSIPQGASSGTAKFSITPTDDNLDTGNETVTVSGTLAGVTVSPAKLTLTDNDGAPSVVVLALSDTSIAENAGATEVTVTATISGTSRWTADQTLPISVTGSGASNVVGFPAVSNFNLTIAKGVGSGSAKFSITPTNDNLDTGNETISVSSTLTGVTVTSANLTLTDDDAAPSAIALSLSPASIAENAGATEVTVTATVSGNTRFGVSQTLPISVSASGASNVVGFPAISNFDLSIARGAGSGSAKFSITPTNDSFDTGNETVTVSGTLTGVSVRSANLTLTDDDVAPSSLALSLSPTSIAENAGTTEVTVTATIGGASRWNTAQTVAISVDGSSSSNAVGFAEVSDFSLTIPQGAGSGTGEFSITPTNDNFDTSNETITVSGVLTGVTVSSANISLIDDDGTPSTIALSLVPTSIAENAGTTDVTVTATIGGNSRWNAEQIVNISVNGSDLSNVVGFTPVSDFNLSIASGAGSGSASFNLTPTNDSANTNNEIVTVNGSIEGVDVTVNSATLTLINDDQQIPSITVTSASAVAEGTATSFALSATPLTNVPTTVNISVSESSNAGFVNPADLGSHTVVIPTSGVVNHVVNTLSDSVDEPNGQVSVAIASGSGYNIGTTNSASVNIIDDDATIVTISREGEDSISEDGGSETIRIQLSRQLQSGETVTAPLSISGTNITSNDYTLSLADEAQLNAGVTMVTSGLHSSSQPAIVFIGNGDDNVRTATIVVVAVDNDDDFASETISIGFGSGNRSVSSNLDSFDGTGSTGTVTRGSVSIQVIDPLVRPPEDEDQGDSRTDAALVYADSSTGGEIEEAGDVDYFRFTTGERGTISISTRSEFHIHCSLENVDGEVIENDDDADGRCRIESDQEQGTFWVAIRGLTGATGPYTLIARVEYDDVSDDMSTPYELAINSTFESQIGSSDDVDHYAVTLEDGAEGTLQIYTLGNTDTHGCVLIEISENDKAIWRCDDDSGSSRNFLIAIETSETRRYIFRVSGHGTTTGRYVLAIEFHASGDSEENQFQGAPLITSTADNWIFTVRSTLEVAAQDAYEVRIPQVSRFVVQTMGAFGMRVMLYRATDLETDMLRSDNAVDGANSEVATNLVGGTYYVVVKGLSENTSGEYTLRLDLDTMDSMEAISSL